MAETLKEKLVKLAEKAETAARLKTSLENVKTSIVGISETAKAARALKDQGKGK